MLLEGRCFFSEFETCSICVFCLLLLTDFADRQTAQVRYGDRNDLKVERLLSLDPALRQVVNFPTNKKRDKILDVVCTDMYAGYQEPTLLPAIQVDPGREGVPSDHWGVEVRPRTNTSTSKATLRKKIIEVQPMPE